MSLLLDALKKAALEKQRREQTDATSVETSAASHKETHLPSQSSDIDDDTPHSEVDVGELNPRLLEEEAEPTLTVDIPEALSLADVHDSDEVEGDESLEGAELEFDIDETEVDYIEESNAASEPEYIQPQTLVATRNIETNRIEPMLSADNSELTTKPKNLTKENLQHEHNQKETSELKPVASADEIESPAAGPSVISSSEPAKVVEPFNPTSGKAALAQLLSRSNKVADHARKRMLIMYLLLAITAVSILVLYYYFLFSSNSSLGKPAIVRHTPVPEAPANEAATDTTTAETSTADNVTNEGTVTTTGDTTRTQNITAEQAGKNPEKNAAVQNAPAKTVVNAPIVNQPKRVAGAGISNAPKQDITSQTGVPVNSINSLVERGYQAYQAGDLNRAETAYREALMQDKYDRDALLGAAAVAVRQGRQQDALTLYQQRLTREPRDEYAHAGIMALSAGSESNPQLESELNRLLYEYPNASYLYFLKGVLYAKQQQWIAAQAALFEAWQRDNKNADLAYNLAIALDHLNQSKEAARFYHQALELANNHPTFSVDSIQRRLQELEAIKQ